MKKLLIILIVLNLTNLVYSANPLKLIAEHAELYLLSDQFKFTEGPAADTTGSIYFTDIPENKIFIYNVDSVLRTFSDTIPGNGLAFDKNEKLIICGHNGARNILRLDVITHESKVLADNYKGKKLNSPNDLWIGKNNGIYFTDPRYGSKENMELKTEQVYYISPETNKIIQVTDDLVKPNGIYGIASGKKLLIADPGAGKVYEYSVKKNGELTSKKIFIDNEYVDGMTVDVLGNIYIASEGIKIYNKNARLIEVIKTPKKPTNVCFGGADFKTLFITARNEVYLLKMNIAGNRY